MSSTDSEEEMENDPSQDMNSENEDEGFFNRVKQKLSFSSDDSPEEEEKEEETKKIQKPPLEVINRETNTTNMIVMLGSLLVLVVSMIAIVVPLVVLGLPSTIILGGFLVVFFVSIVSGYMIYRYVDREEYKIFDDKISVEKWKIRKKHDIFDIEDISSVDTNTNIIEKQYDTGTIILEVSGDEEIHLKSVPDYEEVYDQFSRLLEYKKTEEN